jgi:hypothetical protein
MLKYVCAAKYSEREKNMCMREGNYDADEPMMIIIIGKEEICKILIIKGAIKLRRNKFAEYIALI